MKYLIDTNIISELYRKKPVIDVINWFNSVDAYYLYISCITIGELKAGALKKAKTDKIASHSLNKWINILCQNYKDQIVNINQETCEIWADLLSIDSTNAVDGLIAAQARQGNMSLVTRNTKHFNRFNIDIIKAVQHMIK